MCREEDEGKKERGEEGRGKSEREGVRERGGRGREEKRGIDKRGLFFLDGCANATVCPRMLERVCAVHSICTCM